ncbi:MAG: MoxR family ATPase [Microbacteriaceae bacterium]
MTVNDEQTEWFQRTFEELVSNVDQVVLGKQYVIRLAFTALLSQGHLLLEDYPGTGKTSLARAMAETVDGLSTRIQFTPDLLPGDVTGITIYDQSSAKFEFHAGPIFANIVLADEINRASPKTQSALLEVMEENTVTVDGVTRPVPSPFMVIATQNPIEQAGTYRLPEAQLDRFIMKTTLGYPDHASTMRILEGTATLKSQLSPVITPQAIEKMSELARGVFVSPVILDYISRIIEASRNASQVHLGSSVRGAIALTRVAKTWAISQGRGFVIPDDVKQLANAVLSHRIILDAEAEFDGVTATAVIAQILLEVEPPLENS